MRLLVIRTSAMGDVALVAPVLKSIKDQRPDVELIIITREVFKPFFTSIYGLRFFFPEFNKRHKGISGLFKLYSDLKRQGNVDYVIDLHDVLRSKMLRFLFRVSGTPVKNIDKGRIEKRLVIKGKKKEKLSHSVERYCDVFAKAGFNITLSNGPWIIPSLESLNRALHISSMIDGINIGVAPYARHELKMWPEESMVLLLKKISEKVTTKYWLFGGNDESERLIAFQNRVPESTIISGKLDLEEELAIMSKLNFMISMDSSNMHMAALTGTKVISIWGATDPITGFGAWMQPDERSVRIPISQLACRPCTVYGKGKCRRKDHACMNWLTPEMVFQRLINLDILK
jgi:ADP-heptose:LPS heptosyltransferase